MRSDLVAVLKLAGAGGVANSFDDLGRLRGTVLTNSAGVALNSHAYTYNAAHQRTRQTLKDNNFWEYTYDGIGQLRTARGTNSNNSPRWHEQFGYAYDGAWNLSWRTNNDLRVQFQANDLNQLSAASRSGTLMVAGNVTQGSAPYTVSVAGPGLSSAAAEVYADGSWARQGAIPNNGQSTYTVTASDSQGRTGAGNITVNLPNSGLYYYGFRFYEPNLQRWVNRDPLGGVGQRFLFNDQPACGIVGVWVNDARRGNAPCNSCFNMI